MDCSAAIYIAETARIGHEVMPVWSAHIEEARSQMETAVSTLTRRFGSIVERLDLALQASMHGGSAGPASVLEKSEQDLRGVMESLRDAMASNQAMHAAVRNLTQFVEELDEMTAEVASVATQTNLLAINAAVEAAHAGERGRSFGVLAHEVRKLSAMSAETGRRMAQKVSAISEAISAAGQAADESSKRDAESTSASQQAISGVLNQFRCVTDELEASAETLKRESAGIQSEIVESLVQLQFQDRVSQRMTHVRQNIDRLPDMLDESRAQFEHSGVLVPVNGAALLAELQRSYAMADEHSTHEGGTSAGAHVAASEDITFF
ncbi:methyl-accepting chemotaxis protein [Burkholderia multivorans]